MSGLQVGLGTGLRLKQAVEFGFQFIGTAGALFETGPGCGQRLLVLLQLATQIVCIRFSSRACISQLRYIRL